jgi:hypothetical protein
MNWKWWEMKVPYLAVLLNNAWRNRETSRNSRARLANVFGKSAEPQNSHSVGLLQWKKGTLLGRTDVLIPSSEISRVNFWVKNQRGMTLSHRYGLYLNQSMRRLILIGSSITENILCLVGSEVLTAVIMKRTIFWDITPCSPLSVHRRFGGTCRLHLQGRR